MQSARKAVVRCLLRRRLPAPPQRLRPRPSPAVPAAPGASCLSGLSSYATAPGATTTKSPAPAALAIAATKNVGTSRWGSSPGIAAGADTEPATETPSLPSAFPWREAPDVAVRGVVERAMYAAMQRLHRRLLNLAIRRVDTANDDEAFLRAAEVAFVQVAAGVFQMPAHHVISPLDSENRESSEPLTTRAARGTRRMPAWDIPDGAKVDPRDVMQKDLAEFYLQAAVATKMSTCTPFYRLHGFGKCKISNINVHWGVQRGNPPKGEETHEYWGSKVVVKTLVKDFEALWRNALLQDRSMLDSHALPSLRESTIQVDVDIDCSETFFVADDKTEEVVQGSKAVSASKHRLRLEGSPLSKDDFQWVVVDLDNWMKGNEFW